MKEETQCLRYKEQKEEFPLWECVLILKKNGFVCIK